MLNISHRFSHSWNPWKFRYVKRNRFIPIYSSFYLMKIGYPCINRTLNCTSCSTFRLSSYSEKRLKSTVRNNLSCLKKILEFNLNKGLLFFRISSDIVPFASHSICDFDWEKHFEEELKEIGRFIIENEIRISMHPDQFILLNSPKEDVTKRSIAELEYHRKLLEAMNLDNTAKIQIHVGGRYNDKGKAMERFLERYKSLSESLKDRLVIENDENRYSIKDCLEISDKCSAPVLFDSFHHECLNNNESFAEAIELSKKTWDDSSGPIMVDYSSQAEGNKKGKHARSINVKHFRDFLLETKNQDYDLMLEIKDKEKSAIKARKIVEQESG